MKNEALGIAGVRRFESRLRGGENRCDTNVGAVGEARSSFPLKLTISESLFSHGDLDNAREFTNSISLAIAGPT